MRTHMQLQTCRPGLTCRYRHANIHTDKDMQTNKYREDMQRRTQIQTHKCRHRHIVDDTLVWYDVIWCASQCGQNDDCDFKSYGTVKGRRATDDKCFVTKLAAVSPVGLPAKLIREMFHTRIHLGFLVSVSSPSQFHCLFQFLHDWYST